MSASRRAYLRTLAAGVIDRILDAVEGPDHGYVPED